MPTNTGTIIDAGSHLGLGRCPGEGHSRLPQNACLGNPMDRGGWRDTYSAWGHEELDMTATNAS